MLTFALTLLLAAPEALYSGDWEYQALNAGDTSFKVEHKDQSITFYRVLYPTYEGARYKLEHAYKGAIKGTVITGDMFVREEGMKDFERLRPFTGTIQGADRITMDDLPLRRAVSREPVDDTALASAPEEPKASAPAAPAEDTWDDPAAEKPYRKVVIQQGARDKLAEATPTGPPASASTPSETSPKRLASVALTGALPEITPVNRSLASEEARRAESLLREGDVQYEKKTFREALLRYQKAFKLDPGRIELLYKLGLCHGILGSDALRGGRQAEAGKHYREAISLWQRAVRLDPYNWGAQENIRRAEAKLTWLKKG